MRRILAICEGSLRNWSMLVSKPGAMEHWANELERSVRMLRITWTERQRGPEACNPGNENELDQAMGLRDAESV
jgi:hypothetical protein